MSIGTDQRLDVEKMRKELERTVHQEGLEGSIIFRPTRGGSFVELEARLVRDAFEELVRSSHLACIGIGKITARDKLLYQLFREHAEWCGAIKEVEETETGVQ